MRCSFAYGLWNPSRQLNVSNSKLIPSRKLTASLPLKNGGWETTFHLGRPIFRGYVSFREGISTRFAS